MTIDVTLVPPESIRPLRDLYRQEMNCQIIHDSWHGRGWTDSYLLRLDGRVVGYGLVGGIRANPKDVVTEFYVLPVHRAAALPLFRQLAAASQARSVEVQTNDILLTLMLFDCAGRIESHVVLFHDALTTGLSVPGATSRKVAEADQERLLPTRRRAAGTGWSKPVATSSRPAESCSITTSRTATSSWPWPSLTAGAAMAATWFKS